MDIQAAFDSDDKESHCWHSKGTSAWNNRIITEVYILSYINSRVYLFMALK